MNIRKQLSWLSVPAFLTVVYGVWQFDERYVNAGELTESLKDVEVQHNKIYLQMDITQQRLILQTEFEFRKMVEENPSNEELKSALEDIREEKRIIRERIEKRLE